MIIPIRKIEYINPTKGHKVSTSKDTPVQNNFFTTMFLCPKSFSQQRNYIFIFIFAFLLFSKWSELCSTMLVCSSFMVLTSTVVCPSLVLHRSPPVMFRSVTVVLYSAVSTSLVTTVAEYASPVVGVVESAQFVTTVVGFAPLAIGAAGFALLVEEILQSIFVFVRIYIYI